ALALKVTGAVAREEVGGELHLRAQILRVDREATIACRRQRHDRQALVVAGKTLLPFLHRSTRARFEERERLRHCCFDLTLGWRSHVGREGLNRDERADSSVNGQEEDFHRFGFGISGAPGMSFAATSDGGLSSARKANRSAKSFLSSDASMPSGIIESLLTRVYFTRLRGTASSPSPGIRTTMRCSLSSAIRPVRLRPSFVTTVVTWEAGAM